MPRGDDALREGSMVCALRPRSTQEWDVLAKDGLRAVRGVRFSTNTRAGGPLRSWDSRVPAAVSYLQDCPFEVVRIVELVECAEGVAPPDVTALDEEVGFNVTLAVRVDAAGSGLLSPLSLCLLQQTFKIPGGDVDHTTPPWESVGAQLFVVTSDEPTSKVVRRDNWLTCKSAHTPRDSLHVEEWDSGPESMSVLLQKLREYGPVLADDAALVHLFVCLLNRLYDPVEEGHPLRGYAVLANLYERQLFMSVVPALLCSPPRPPTFISNGKRINVLLPTGYECRCEEGAPSYDADEWLWPLYTVECIKNDNPGSRAVDAKGCFGTAADGYAYYRQFFEKIP